MAQSVKLIIGLGNPGKEYEQTRHNFGFMAIDSLLNSSGNWHPISGKKDAFILWKGTLPGTTGTLQTFLMKPLTFMNKSGEAVQRVTHYYDITCDDILVLHDELDIPFGRMKIKTGGGNAGHNGLKSIQQHLGTPMFSRLRLGIGKPAGFDTSSYVLSKFAQPERCYLSDIFTTVQQTVRFFCQEKFQEAQRTCNSFQLPAASLPV